MLESTCRRLLGMASAALVVGFVQAAEAQWQPTERITLVSQSSTGTGNDLMLRKIADIWTKNSMVPNGVGVENVTGALGENARRYVASENAQNPHVLFAYTPGTLNQTILSKSEYTSDKFTPIALMASDPVILVTGASSPFQTLDDLVAAAKEKPGSVIQGGGPYGGSASIGGRMLQDAIGAELPYTPFKGGGEAVTALLGNHVQFLIENPSEVMEHIASGQMRALATSTKMEALPDVPTFEEAKIEMPLLDAFRAIVAPPGIPEEAAAYYTDLLDKTRATTEWQEYLKETALVENWVTGQDLGKYLADMAVTYRDFDEKMGLLK